MCIGHTGKPAKTLHVNTHKCLKASTLQHLMSWPQYTLQFSELKPSQAGLQMLTIRRSSHLCSERQTSHLHISVKRPLREVVNTTPTYIEAKHGDCSAGSSRLSASHQSDDQQAA